MLYRSADCPYAECHILFIIMLNAILLCHYAEYYILFIVMLNAIMLSVIMLSVVAPFRRYGFSHHLVST